jgi:TPR repeat protein
MHVLKVRFHVSCLRSRAARSLRMAAIRTLTLLIVVAGVGFNCRADSPAWSHLPGQLLIREISRGTGPEATIGSKVSLRLSFRRFDVTDLDFKDLRVGIVSASLDGQECNRTVPAITCVLAAVKHMKVGGKRIIILPPGFPERTVQVELMMVGEEPDATQPAQVSPGPSSRPKLDTRNPALPVTSVSDLENARDAFLRGNFAVALSLYLALASQGSIEAQTYVGRIYENGLGIAKNTVEAERWYRSALGRAAEKLPDDPGSLTSLGWMYDEGKVVEKNSNKALEFYRRAAEQGYPRAEHNLGICYQTGDGVPKDNKQAVAWFRRAVSHNYAPSMLSLGDMYFGGYGIEQNYDRAFEFYKQASDKGVPEANHNIATMYESGIGVFRNISRSVELYRLAAERGVVESQVRLCWMYENGKGVTQNTSLAIAWCQKASAQGSKRAREILASIPNREPTFLRLADSVSIAFVRIPKGEFRMGCSVDDQSNCVDQKPPHRVRITKSFEMGRTEVTQQQWQAVMHTNPSETNGPDLPVQDVTWEMVQSFFRKLNERNDGYSYRLPTEAEWEYAARAGTVAANPDDVQDFGWMKNRGMDSPVGVHPVAQKLPNDWGLYDMLGNVGELVGDWWGLYTDEEATDPIGPRNGSYHIIRGGSHMESFGSTPLSQRDKWGVLNFPVGFRCVRFRLSEASTPSHR